MHRNESHDPNAQASGDRLQLKGDEDVINVLSPGGNITPNLVIRVRSRDDLLTYHQQAPSVQVVEHSSRGVGKHFKHEPENHRMLVNGVLAFNHFFRSAKNWIHSKMPVQIRTST